MEVFDVGLPLLFPSFVLMAAALKKTPEGVCSVKFKDEEAAAKCIEVAALSGNLLRNIPLIEHGIDYEWSVV